MLNPAPFILGETNLFDQSINLRERPFFRELYITAMDKCVEFTGFPAKCEKNQVCRNETMIAASCVLLNKANNQYGDFRNNVRLCKHEISLAKKHMKANYSDFEEEKFDKWLKGLDLSITTFI